MGGNFREMLDTVIRINFRGYNFRGTRVRAIGADDVISKISTRGWTAEVQFQRHSASLYSVSATLLRQ